MDYWRQIEVEIANHMAHRTDELVDGLRPDHLVRVHPGVGYLDEYHDQSHEAEANTAYMTRYAQAGDHLRVTTTPARYR